VVSFYKFANLPDYEQKRAPLKELCESHVRISLTLWRNAEPWGQL
jgi:predicted sulfurtransferase